MEASIASVLEVALADVPDLYDPEDPQRARTWPRLLRWLAERGWAWVGGPLGRDVPAAELELPRDLPDVAIGCGLTTPDDWTGWCLLLGVNPDGLGHAVVGRAGAIVHDPNPSRRGLVTIDEVAVLLPLARLERWPACYATGGAMWRLP